MKRKTVEELMAAVHDYARALEYEHTGDEGPGLSSTALEIQLRTALTDLVRKPMSVEQVAPKLLRAKSIEGETFNDGVRAGIQIAEAFHGIHD